MAESGGRRGQAGDVRGGLAAAHPDKPVHEGHTWLVNAHNKLNAAVAAAYGWDADIGDEEVLERLLGLNLERAEGET